MHIVNNKGGEEREQEQENQHEKNPPVLTQQHF